MPSFGSEIILTASPDRPIEALDPHTGATLARFHGSRPPRQGLAVVGDALIAASHVSAAGSASIRLYNWWSAAALYSIPAPEPVAPIAATPDGAFLFSGGLSGRIHAFALASGDLLRSFRAHGQPVSCLAISDDRSLLISGGGDGTIAVFPTLRLLDAASGEDDDDDSAQLALHRFPAHGQPVTAVAAGPGGCSATVISSSLDGTCKVWGLADGVHLWTARFPCAVWCVVADPTNSEAYAGGSDGKVYAIPLKAGERRRRAERGVEILAWGTEERGGVTALAFANGDQNLVSASENGLIRIWAVESGQVVRTFGSDDGGSVISHLVVARGIAAGTNGAQPGDESTTSKAGFCERQMNGREVTEIREMEAWLGVVAADRERAINTLEVAIRSYEKLLGLLLKEAKGVSGNRERLNL